MMEFKKVDDRKKRSKIDRDNMDKYKYAGIEIDELLTNGLQMYIPYDIYNLLLESIQYSLKNLLREQAELSLAIEKLELENFSGTGFKSLKDFSENRLKEIEGYIKVFEAMIDINQK